MRCSTILLTAKKSVFGGARRLSCKRTSSFSVRREIWGLVREIAAVSAMRVYKSSGRQDFRAAVPKLRRDCC
jgi:hypothetical protein